jgi:hypothetical protein
MDGKAPRSRQKKAKASKTEKRPVRGRSIARMSAAPDAPVMDPGERHQMIALAAYYRAEQRGFVNGDPLRDWLEAEVEVTRRLREIGAGKPVS